MDKTFNIKCTMSERWVDEFCSMLRLMERDGNIGHSEIIAFFADGDGDFNPKFEIGIDYNNIPRIDCATKKEITRMFDAG